MTGVANIFRDAITMLARAQQPQNPALPGICGPQVCFLRTATSPISIFSTRTHSLRVSYYRHPECHQQSIRSSGTRSVTGLPLMVITALGHRGG